MNDHRPRKRFGQNFLVSPGVIRKIVAAIDPRAGDTIVEIDGNHTFIFEVMALGGDPPWRYSDPFRLKLRIHTKQIESSQRSRVLVVA